MSAHRLFVAYVGLLIVASTIGALLGMAASRDVHDPIMEQHP